MDERPLRNDGYYYSFVFTGVDAIDLILSAVAWAGKAYHHTEDWNEPDDDGVSEVDRIQAAANAAAEELKARDGTDA
jgi:hypothetical protein